MYRLLIIEDDKGIAEAIKTQAEMWGMQAHMLTNFRDVMAEFAKVDPHIVLLDIGLPFFNGYHWCGEIRKVSKVPIIFISSASDNMNMIMAMNMGADDFIAKPFDLNVLTAKINAMMRRTYSYQGNTNVISVGDVVLNLSEGKVSCGDKQAELTKNEYKILQLLMENNGTIVDRDRIITCLWEGDEFIDDNTLTVNVTRIRKKLKSIGVDDFIKTKKGVGYII